MTHPPGPAELIELICHQLDEVQHYVIERPGCASGVLHSVTCDISRLTLYLRPSQEFTIDRLRFNLMVARQYVEIAPDVAAAYAKGCRFELGKLAEELAKHAGEARR